MFVVFSSDFFFLSRRQLQEVGVSRCGLNRLFAKRDVAFPLQCNEISERSVVSYREIQQSQISSKSPAAAFAFALVRTVRVEPLLVETLN